MARCQNLRYFKEEVGRGTGNLAKAKETCFKGKIESNQQQKATV